MRGYTHLAAGLAVAATMPEAGATELVGLALGALLPDIDSPSSIVGRYVPILPQTLPHRTITHSFAACIAMAFIYKPIAYGMFTHLLLDMLNPEGVPLLWPMRRKFRVPILGKIRSGSVTDRLIGSLLWIYIVFNYATLMGLIPYSLFA